MAKKAKKQTKKKAKKALNSPRPRATKKAAKKRATKSKQVAKKTKKSAKKAARKPAAKKTAKKSVKKSAKKAKAKKPASAPKQASAPKKAAKPKTEVTRAAAVPAAAAAPAPSRGNAYYITTAIAYPNGMPHIGHAYEAIATDALARFQRLDGKDVFFLTGTDEHGQKMIQTAQAEGMTPAELATRNAGRFKAMDERLNVSFDRFIRTSEDATSPLGAGDLESHGSRTATSIIDTYAGWYSVRDEAYYAEDETVVGEDNVRRGPQGTPVEWVEEKSYFFKLSAYQDRLLRAL